MVGIFGISVGKFFNNKESDPSESVLAFIVNNEDEEKKEEKKSPQIFLK